MTHEAAMPKGSPSRGASGKSKLQLVSPALVAVALAWLARDRENLLELFSPRPVHLISIGAPIFVGALSILAAIILKLWLSSST